MHNENNNNVIGNDNETFHRHSWMNKLGQLRHDVVMTCYFAKN